MTETLEQVEARRAARKASLAASREAQRAVDVAALDAAEAEYGDESVVAIDVPFSPGLPTLAVARCPKPVELKVYRARLREATPNPIKAAEELAANVVVYPSGDALAGLYAARPGLQVQLGVASLQLAIGREVEQGKG
jgi:hypothetical protein